MIRTDSSNDEGNEVVCSVLAGLEDVDGSADEEAHDENDGCRKRRVVSRIF